MAVPILNINSIIDQYFIHKDDVNRRDVAHYKLFAKWVMRDLHLNILPEPKRIILRLNKKNNTVAIPSDYYRFGSICFVDDCGYPIPLSFNQYINWTPNTIAEDCIEQNKCCKCKGTSEICDEVSTFETVTETVQVPTPVSTTHSYSITFPVNSFSIAIDSYVLNGNTVTVGTVIHNQGELDAFFVSIGWTKDSNTKYEIDNTSNVWGCFTFEGGVFGGETNLCTSHSCPTQVFEDVEYTNTTNIKTCENGDVIKEVCAWTQIVTPINCCEYQMQFVVEDLDFTITNYRKNNTDYTVSVDIENLNGMIFYMSSLGFSFLLGIDPNTGKQYVKFFTTTFDTWNSLTYDNGESVTNDFVNHGCEQGQSISVEKVCTTQVLCNVPVLPCGCIVPSPEIETTLIGCCGGLLQSVTAGICRNTCQTPTPLPNNAYGSYKIDTEDNLIHVETPYKVDSLLLSYFNDGTVGGQMLIPEYALDAVLIGIKRRESMVNRRFSPAERTIDKQEYKIAKRELFKYLNTLSLGAWVRAVNLQPKFSGMAQYNNYTYNANGGVFMRP